MSLDLVRQLLDTQLSTLLPALLTAWENVDVSPTIGVPYQATNLLPAQPGNPVYGPGFVEQGIYQVTLCYPTTAGAKDAVARAEQIRAAFPRGASFSKSGLTLSVSDTPEIMQGTLNGDIFQLPVRVRWYANVGL